MKHSVLYDWETRFNFGKHKGQTFKEVFQTDSQYISWCFQMIDWFCITDEIFEKMPIVISLKKNNFPDPANPQKNWLHIFIEKHNLKKSQIVRHILELTKMIITKESLTVSTQEAMHKMLRG